MSEPVKPSELTNIAGELGIKVYLCQPCAAKLRALSGGAPLRELDLLVLCPECRSTAINAHRTVRPAPEGPPMNRHDRRAQASRARQASAPANADDSAAALLDKARLTVVQTIDVLATIYEEHPELACLPREVEGPNNAKGVAIFEACADACRAVLEWTRAHIAGAVDDDPSAAGESPEKFTLEMLDALWPRVRRQFVIEHGLRDVAAKASERPPSGEN